MFFKIFLVSLARSLALSFIARQLSSKESEAEEMFKKVKKKFKTIFISKQPPGYGI